LTYSLRAELRRPECLLLTGAALLTRFWGLFNPNAVVWDEKHYERFAGSYLTATNYYDVHPPLGKLLLAGAAKLLGVSGQALLTDQPAPLARVLPALVGALIIPVVYLLMRAFGASRPVATLGAALLVLDNALLVESRFILTDGMLVLFVFTAVLCYVVSRLRTGRARWSYVVAAAIAAGMAASVKWTGLSALGLILAAFTIDALLGRVRAREWITTASVFLIVPALVYVASFAVHFALIGYAGQYANLSFGKAFVAINRDMQGFNAGWSGATHPAASAWYSWPIAKHPPGFWFDPPASPGGTRRWIVMYANPVVWWGTLIALGSLVFVAFTRRAAVAPHRTALLFLTAGYVMNFAPFAFITRPMYLYHYFVALIFSVMLAAMSVGILLGLMDNAGSSSWPFPTPRTRAVYFGVIGFATIAFAIIAPFSYGWPLTERGMASRQRLLQRHVQETPVR
jgi:dolichyl-phosphate-mannose--protein O-mannosyl transferase